MLRANQLDVDRAMVLVIDMQDKLLPFIRHKDRVLAAGRKLLESTSIFGLPVLATEQYPKGIGSTDETIRRCLDAAGATVIEKTTMSGWAQREVRDMVSRDYDMFVCADAIGSRGRIDYEQSLERMRQDGAFVTTVESVLFELCQRCDTPKFKAMLDVVKASPPPDD